MVALFTLPNELLLASLASQFPCRDQQIRSLATLLSIQTAPSKNIVLHGLEATGKSAITKAILEALSANSLAHNDVPEEQFNNELKYSIIKSAECISGRHLLEQTIGAIANAVEWRGNIPRCENLAQLVVEVGKLLEGWTSTNEAQATKQRFVLVFDGIDRQKEAPPTLLPALARMGEIIPHLTTIFITTVPRPSFFHLPGIPHIQFPSYTKSELVTILSRICKPSPRLPGGSKETFSIWERLIPTIYDSLSKHSGRDLLSFRTICLQLWPTFIQPILNGTYTSNEFSRLLIANRALLQNDTLLTPSVLAPTTSSTKTITSTTKPQIQNTITTHLPYHTRLLLIASYLASHNPPRTDQHHFLQQMSISRRKKRGGGTALTASTSRPGVSKSRKIPRKLLGPQAFLLERMIAIYHVLLEDADGRGRYSSINGNIKRKTKGLGTGEADIQMAIATLASLRLIAKMGSVNAADTLDGGSRWRVAVGWEVVRGIARSVGVEAEDYLAE
ncbi:hypothetical protein sscle_11g083350 [Sclerotinia sclerotiorum 1980 UF-70]|uniref:Uncharacterized protein n=1 Tax=Sclerotinia sclerotiorum (strain ATCC 18683 / 1980 / Ss-1) TaxID=665079 RepID=A0A1D9QF57_SCLS1|nr:hypothetical protein sscle_11g083350 [Sclerotinia sclerotiorum 1980 UF-70]